MKSNNKAITKKGKIIAIIIAILLACCITVSGIILFNPQQSSAPAVTNAATSADPATTVTVTSDKTEVTGGDTFTLTITISTTRTERTWYCMQALLTPLNSNGSVNTELLNSLTWDRTVSRPQSTVDGFDDYGPPKANDWLGQSYEARGINLQFYRMDGGVSASLSAVYQIRLKVADSYTNTSSFKFAFSPDYDNFVVTVPSPQELSTRVQVTDVTEGTAKKEGWGDFLIDSVVFNDDGSGTPDVQPTLSKLELATSTTGPYSEVTAGGNVTWKIADHAVNSYVYFRATVPTDATASASTGLSATSTTNVFRGQLAYGTNTFKVKVQGTSTSREYAYTINLREQVNTISNITASPALTGFTFNSATTTYNNLEVENSVTSLTLTVTLDGDYETLTASGSPTKSNTGKVYTLVYNLNTGTNTITLRGVSDASVNGTQYTLTVNRKSDSGTTPPGPTPSTDSSLTGLEITSGGKPATLSPSFRPDKTDGYTATVDDIDDLNINPTPNPNAKDTETKITDNGDGTKTVTVTVTAEDDSTTEYTITVKEKEKPSVVDPPHSEGDALLSGIYLNASPAGTGDYSRGNLINGFDPEVYEYHVFAPSNSSFVHLTAIAADSNANVVMYVNGIEADAGNFGQAMDFVFLPNIKDTALVEFVVSTDDDTRTYKLYVTRSEANPYLTYLSVSSIEHGTYQITDASGKLISQNSLNASNKIRDFYVTIENDDRQLTLLANAYPENATVIIQDKIDVLDFFQGKATADLEFSVVILDDSGKPMSGTVSYTLHLTRKPALTSDINARIIIDEITKAHNSVIFNDEYAQDWNTDRIVYGANEPYYRVPYNVSALTVHVYPEAIGELIAPPTYQIFYGDVLKSNNGVENTSLRLNYTFNVVTIVITSSDLSASKTVVVIVYREEPSLKLNPTILEIPEFTDEYQAEVVDYAYTVGHDVTGLTVRVDWDRDMYTCMIEGADSLKVGHNIVTISLYEKASGISNTAASTDKPNAVRTITLDVFRESNGPSTIWLILFIVFLLLAILEFIILLLLLLRNRKETERVTERVVVQPAPAPVVRQQVGVPPVAPVQFVAMPQPQVQYVSVPQPQPQPMVTEKPQQPVNVEVKITGCGDSDGHYKTKK